MISNPWDFARKSQAPSERSRSLRLDLRPKIIKPLTRLDSDMGFEPIDIPSITWDDFAAPPNRDSPWAAHTYWDVRYKYRVTFFKDKPLVQINVRCKINTDASWVKRKDDKLLAHERGHYLIGWICALEFKKRVKEARLSPQNYSYEIEKIFKETLREFLRWELLYDQETEHYKNLQNQLKWNLLIAQKLDQVREFLEN